MPRTVNYDRLFNNCSNVYSEFERESTVREDNTRWFSGSLTEIRDSLALYPGAFTLAIQTLKKMSCIEQKKRGTRFSESQFLLVGAPDRTVFNELKVPVLESAASLKEQNVITDQHLRRLIASIGSLNVQEALAGLANSFTDLEKRVEDLEQQIYGKDE